MKKNYYKKDGNGPKKKKDVIEQTGTIIENLGNTNFKVELDTNPDITVIGTISGKMRMNYIRVMTGDKVVVEMSPYDLTRCRIVSRLKTIPTNTQTQTNNGE